MPNKSKRRKSLAAKKAQRVARSKPKGLSKYALKKQRMAQGWNNPRSPFHWSET